MSSDAPSLTESAGSFTKDAANLDFLRAFAVLCVFVRHILSEHGDPTRPWFQPQAIGIFGVMTFFVHTSLVLMLSLERQARPATIGFSGTYASFLVRRAFRVYPLSASVVLLVWFVLPPAMSHVVDMVRDGSHTLPTLLANLSLTNNLNGHPYVIGTLWTLPLELQMYLFLPLLFLLARRVSGGTLLVLWPLMAGMAFLCRYRLHAPEVLGYVPCFFSGVLAYCLGQRGRTVLPFWVLPVVLVVLLEGYMIAYGRIRSQTPLGWIVCLGLGLLLPHVRPLSEAMVATVSKVVAKYSYGIYLTHTFGIYLGYRLLAGAPEVAHLMVAALTTALFSYLSFHLVESPGMAIGAKVAQSLRGGRRLPKAEPPAP